jgi:hypothetical protein
MPDAVFILDSDSWLLTPLPFRSALCVIVFVFVVKYRGLNSQVGLFDVLVV